MRKYKVSSWAIILIFLFLLIFFLSLRKIMDLDLGFHLKGGEWMLQNKSFHKKDIFTYTVKGNEYIAMYWLYQIFLFLIYKLSGYAGISIMNSIIITFLFWLIFLRMKKMQVPLWICFSVIFLMVFSMEIRFSVRPEVFTWIFMTLVLFILDQYFYKKNNYLFLLPLIQIFWVNFHGLFILGWFLMSSYFLSSLIHFKRFDIKFFKYIFLSIICSFLNPYTWKGVLFPFYLFTRLQSSSIFKDVISEFTSPFSKKALILMPKLPLISFYIFAFTSILFFILTFKKRKFHEFLIFSGFFYLAYTAVRNIPLFLIVTSQIIALSLYELSERLKILINFKFFRILQKLTFYTAGIWISLVLMRLFTNAYYVDRGGGNFGVGIDQTVHPVGAANFIVGNNLKGRVLNDLNHGSWFIWKISQPVFIDGRLEVIKEKFFEKYHRSYSHGGLKSLIYEYNPDMIVFDYSYPEALFWDRDIKSMPDWRIVYWDSKSVIFAKENFATHIKKLNFMGTIKEMGIDTTIGEEKLWEILLIKPESNIIDWFKGFFKSKESQIPLLKMAFYAYLSLEFKCAEILYLESLKRGCKLYDNIYFNLGAVYFFKGEYDKAVYCYERVLKESPENIRAEEMLKRIKGLK